MSSEKDEPVHLQQQFTSNGAQPTSMSIPSGDLQKARQRAMTQDSKRSSVPRRLSSISDPTNKSHLGVSAYGANRAALKLENTYKGISYE